jgi:ferric-dicitrate binding protein FerR (iron transport regulator)
MSPESKLPENDRDLRLARLFEQARAEGSFPGPDQDPLFGDLNVYREMDSTEMHARAIDSESIWSRVEQEMEESKPRTIKLMPGNTIARWAAAAVLLIAVTIGLYSAYEAVTPDLIARAEAKAAEVVLDDGTIVTLRPYSELYREEYSSTVQTYTLSGEGYFQVDESTSRTFSVNTANARVTVLGTTFMLSSRDTRSTVFLEEGRLRFERLGQDSSVILNPGEYSETINGSVAEPQAAVAVVYKDWLENLLVLQNQSAEEVLAEVEQHYNIGIDATGVTDDTLGGTLRLDSLEQVLSDLEIVLGGKFVQVAERTYRFEPEN